jgi:hypothetical protein
MLELELSIVYYIKNETFLLVFMLVKLFEFYIAYIAILNPCQCMS